MNLHEYQAKELFRGYGIPVSDGRVVSRSDDVQSALAELGIERCVVKAQVHAGGRGKAGGVKLINTVAEAETFTGELLGTRLVTIQTDEKGQPINEVLLEVPSDIVRELYLSLVIDRAQQRIIVMASTEGGVEIEEVAEHHPEKILRFVVDPMLGVMPYQARDVGFALGLEGKQINEFVALLMKMGQVFVENDCAQIEINPLIVNGDGHLLCLDAKVGLDSNAMYRQKALARQRDETQEDERENRAQEHELNYIALDGEIGCMVNGAGLAMATMDLIKLYGGSPANFLDVGGGATKERVTEAFKIILSDENVKAILINIFGGIVRCDIIADGIIAAVSEADVQVPIVVRLEGNNAKLGLEKLNSSGMNIIAAEGFAKAAEAVVNAVEGK